MKPKQIINSLSGITKSATFVTLKNYKSSSGSVADYSIVINVDYKNAVRRSIDILNKKVVNTPEEKLAKTQLLDSLKKSENSSEKDSASGYIQVTDKNGNVIKGIKYNANTDKYYIFGMVVHKKSSDSNNSKSKSIKDGLRDLCPVSKFRQFTIDSSQLDSISVGKKKLYV